MTELKRQKLGYNKAGLTPENIYPNPDNLYIDLRTGYSQDSFKYLEDRLHEQEYNQLDIVKMNSSYKEQSLSSCNLIKKIYYSSIYLIDLLIDNKVICFDKSGAVLNELIEIVSGKDKSIIHILNNDEVDKNIQIAHNKLSYVIPAGRLVNPKLIPSDAIRYIIDNGKTNYGFCNFQIVPSTINNMINHLRDSYQYYLTGDNELDNKNN